jgi:hypothetical protein
MAQEETSSPEGRQRLFNIIGFLGFLAFIPPVLKSLGIAGPFDWLAANAGIWGSAPFFLIYFYAFPLLDLIFGSDRRLSPMLFGIIISFLLFSLVLPLPFMDWYRGFFTQLEFLKCSFAVLVLGLLAMLFGILLSYVKRGLPGSVQILVIVLIPLAALIAGIVFKADALLKLPVFQF